MHLGACEEPPNLWFYIVVHVVTLYKVIAKEKAVIVLSVFICLDIFMYIIIISPWLMLVNLLKRIIAMGRIVE